MNTAPFPFTDDQIKCIDLLKYDVTISVLPYIQSEIVPLLPVDYIIAGGLFPSLYHGTIVKDIDVFLLNNGNVFSMLFEKLVPLATLDDQHIASQSGDIIFNSNQKNREYINTLGNDMIRAVLTLRPISMTDRAKDLYGRWRDTNVQFILTKYKTREELIAHFDFAHCQMNYHNGTVYVSPRTFNAIQSKELINNHDKVQTWRVEKYQAKGYSYRIEHSTVPLRNKILSEYIDEHFEKMLGRKTA